MALVERELAGLVDERRRLGRNPGASVREGADELLDMAGAHPRHVGEDLVHHAPDVFGRGRLDARCAHAVRPLCCWLLDRG